MTGMLAVCTGSREAAPAARPLNGVFHQADQLFPIDEDRL
jgi:hypothetical protein